MELFMNYPLWAAAVGMIIAQVIKILIRLLLTREFVPSLALSSGGMPSSHSSAVASLTTAVAITDGVESTLFGAVLVFSIIIMYDSSGVRRQSGKQAIILNQLIRDFQAFTQKPKDGSVKHDDEKLKTLKELLGHEPIEVFFGALLGIGIALFMYLLY